MKVSKSEDKKSHSILEKIKFKPKYKIVGEDLPENYKNSLNTKLLILGSSIGIIVVFVGTYLINYLKMVIKSLGSSKNLMDIKFGKALSFDYFKIIGDVKNYFCIAIVIIIAITFLVYSKLNHESESNIAYGQKGDSRFATIKEIQKEYKEIPDRKKKFKGVGGVPVSHYQDKYYIDTDTVNTIVLGTSRSGKGETFVVPLIDILSRAEEQSNMIVNDPKGELFSASKETLEKRGYRVLVLNIDDPLQSMSFNPLQLVIDAWSNHDYHEASKRANTLTSMLFASGMGTENEFFYKSAKSAINAIILTIVEYCFKNNCIEKITMYNVAQMLNELGSLFYIDEKTNREVNALDEYFNSLPQGNQAKIQYGSTSFAGDKAKGSILSTASQGIEMFTSDLFGKLTSKMSIDLKEIGFPKSLQFKVNASLVGKRVCINFLRKDKENKVKIIKSYKVKIKALGLCVLNFPDELKDKDILEIKYETDIKKYRNRYLIKFPKRANNYDTKLLTKKFKSVKGYSDLEINSLILKYTEQPTAIFMVVPDYDPSNHIIASIFISQLYTELASNCKNTANKKCFRRIHFILDEFGNMPAIDNMDGIMTVCLGRNILFDLIVQSYSQLENRYDKGAKIIKENCQNHIFIMSNDDDTVEEISKKCGHKTTINRSANAKQSDTDSSITSSADEERIITFERLNQLIEGEQVILRNLHRQDKDRKKIRPFPIFNTKQTNMPYRYQFLNDDFDTRRDINEIDIACEHVDLSLKDNLIPYANFIKDLVTRIQYSIINELPISAEDYNDYLNLSKLQQVLDKDKIQNLVTDENDVLANCMLEYKKYSLNLLQCTEKCVKESIIDQDTFNKLQEKVVESKQFIKEKNVVALYENIQVLKNFRYKINDNNLSDIIEKYINSLKLLAGMVGEKCD